MDNFVREVENMTPVEILNYYRNLYYAEPQTTEQGVVANAINEVLPKTQAAHKKMLVQTMDYGTHYRNYYFCPACNSQIGDKTFDGDRQIGQGTVLHSNKFPNHCPYCGEKVVMVEC